MHPRFPVEIRYQKLIFDWLMCASICNSTIAPAKPLAYIIVSLYPLYILCTGSYGIAIASGIQEAVGHP